MKFLFILASFLVVLQSVNSTTTESELTPILQLKDGKVRGRVIEVGNKKLEFFEGIRFATAKRYELAQPVAPWTDVYEATHPRDACPQFGFSAEMLTMIQGNTTQSEDCLYLNIWKPVGGDDAETRRPVMVWIHGGAYEMGTIFTEMYDAKHLAAVGDLVVVAIQYRLGPLGFLNGDGVPSNIGFRDQIQALTWIQKNIHTFGGDPQLVTIFGESAGSVSVGAMVLSPLARGLFIRAIAQSGSPMRHSQAEPLEKSLERTVVYAKKVNCPTEMGLNETIRCLKGKSVEELQNATLGNFALNELFIPIYGDAVLPVRPSVAVQKGQFNQVDYLYGVCRDEGTGFIPSVFPELLANNTTLTVESTKQYIIKLQKSYNEAAIAQEVADYYVNRLINPTQEHFKLAIAAAMGDSHLVCPSVLFGEELAKRSVMTKHIWSFRLMQVAGNVLGLKQKWIGVSHGSDVEFLFPKSTSPKTAAFIELSTTMQRDWTTFARTGRPHSPTWTEAFNRQTDDFNARYFHLEAGHYKMVDGYYRETCSRFWKPKIMA